MSNASESHSEAAMAEGIATADQVVGAVVQGDLDSDSATLDDRRDCAVGLAADRTPEAIAAAKVVIAERLRDSELSHDIVDRLLCARGILEFASAFADNGPGMAATLATSAGAMELRFRDSSAGDSTSWRAELISRLASMPTQSLDEARSLVPVGEVAIEPFDVVEARGAASRALDEAAAMRSEFE